MRCECVLRACPGWTRHAAFHARVTRVPGSEWAVVEYGPSARLSLPLSRSGRMRVTTRSTDWRSDGDVALRAVELRGQLQRASPERAHAGMRDSAGHGQRPSPTSAYARPRHRLLGCAVRRSRDGSQASAALAPPLRAVGLPTASCPLAKTTDPGRAALRSELGDRRGHERHKKGQCWDTAATWNR